jgi:HK97 family phage portal protein
MRVLGYDITVTKAVPTPTQPLYGDRGSWWWPIIREPFTGAWQRNVELRAESVVTYFAVYACVSLISTDIGKLRLRLMAQDSNGLWTEVNVPAFSPVLRKPNHYQTRAKFVELWMISKLLHGNTYVLKERDQRGVVVRLYILEPTRIKVLVAPDGSIFYELGVDHLSGLSLPAQMPASEIIHDIMVPLFHPLCGISPLLAAALPVSQGLNIQKSSSKFFANSSQPGGIVSTPEAISDDKAQALKERWEDNFSGDNAGRVAILGYGMKYEPLGIPAEEAQLIEQLKWTAENVCSVFHVPPHMVGIGTAPTYNNIEALNQQYYSQCLQTHIEAIESLLDEGLGLTASGLPTYGTEFDLDDLLRMDTATKTETTADAVKAGFMSPNEARAKFNLKPTAGGESPYLQIQNYSLEALSKRDAATQLALTPPPSSSGDDDEDQDDEDEDEIDVERIFTLSRAY